MTRISTRAFRSISLALLAAALPTAHAQNLAENAHWDNRFGLIGNSAREVVAENGRIVAVGSFDCLDEQGNLSACTFAIWDGTGWRFEAPTSDQPGLKVNTVALIPNGIYIGGSFTSIDGQPFNYVAFWDGSQWQPLGTGVDDVVYTLHTHPNGIYAGGQFTQAGGQTARRVALWNGIAWEPLMDINTGNGVNGVVRTITSVGSSVFLGGDFSTAGGVTGANLVVQWNPTAKTWTKLGTGLGYNGLHVYDLEVVAGELVAAGNFVQSGDGTAMLPQIARFDGAAWVPVGTHPYGAIQRLHPATPGGLYASYFGGAGPPGAGDLAVWDGTTWGPVGDLASTYHTFLAGDGNVVYASAYLLADGRSLSGFGQWDGTQWSSIGQGVGTPMEFLETNSVLALAHLNGTLYASGDFNYAGGERVRGLAQWDGTKWAAVGQADTDHSAGPRVMVAGGGNLYVGVPLGSVGGVAANGVARWDGTAWHPLGDGVENGSVNALLLDGTDLYAGGSFFSFDDPSISRIARWDGTAWHALGDGLGAGTVRAMAKHDGKLYVGGDFSTLGDLSTPANHVAVWDGTAWSAVGAGLGDSFDVVRAMTVYQGELYAALDVQNGSGPALLLRWDGSAWVEVAGFTRDDGNNDLFTLFANGDDLYVGGNFTAVDGTPIGRVARWDGTAWSGLGTGLPGLHGSVHTILGTPNGLWIGGNFQRVGDKAAHNVARWDDFTLATTIGPDVPAPAFSVSMVHPNPASAQAAFTVSVPEAQRVHLALYDVLGRQVALLHDGVLSGERTFTVDGTRLPTGLYFVRVEGTTFREARPLVLVR